MADQLRDDIVSHRIKPGSRITAKEIADAIQDSLHLEVDRRKIQLEEPIRSCGTASVVVRLYPDITATVFVVVKEA